MAGDDQLKAVRQARIVLKTLGKRADLDGVIAYEGRVDDGVLAQLIVNLGDDLPAVHSGLISRPFSRAAAASSSTGVSMVTCLPSTSETMSVMGRLAHSPERSMV